MYLCNGPTRATDVPGIVARGTGKLDLLKL